MVFVQYEEIIPTKARVLTCLYDTAKLTDEQLIMGVLVDSIPDTDKELEKVKIPELFINPQTKELWYEYNQDAPLSLDEKIAKLEQDNKTMQETINFLLGL